MCIKIRNASIVWLNTILMWNLTSIWIQYCRHRESVRSWNGNKNERSEECVARSDGWWRRLRSRQTPRTLATFDRQFLSSFRMRRAWSSSPLLPPSLSFSLFFFRPTFVLHRLPPLFQLFISFSHNPQSLPKSKGGTSRPTVVIRVFVGAPINRFTAQRVTLDTSRGPASSRHTVVIRFKVASLTRSPFVSSLAGRARSLDDGCVVINAAFELNLRALCEYNLVVSNFFSIDYYFF